MDARRQSGMSLIELMIALTIGLVLLAGLTYVFVNSSKSQRVGQDAAQQNDNARYAMDTLTSDLHLAGYFGQYKPKDGTGALPDPCTTTPATSDLGFPVQGYVAVMPTGSPVVPSNQYPDLSATTCTTWLPQKNLMPGSDVLVVRHVDGTPLAVGATSVSNQIYLQTNPTALSPVFEIGNGSTMTTATAADGTTATLTVYQSSGGPPPPKVAGPINQYYVNIYFVAPCSVPSDGSSICTGSTDDNGHPIPTLKLLQLGLDGTGTLTFNITTVAEGIQAMKLEYGIDNSPSSTAALTGYIGDGEADGYEPNMVTATPAATDFPSTVSVKIFLISRSTTTVNGFKDTKEYQMGSPSSYGFFLGATTGNNLSYGPYNDAYMRHGYVTEVRLINVAGRRETN